MTTTGIDAVVFGVDDAGSRVQDFLDDWGLRRDSPVAGEAAGGDLRYLTRDGSQIIVRPAASEALPPPIESGSTVREVIWGVSEPADLATIAAEFGGDAHTDAHGVHLVDPMGLAITLRLTQRTPVGLLPTLTNSPGAPARVDARAPFYERAEPHEVSHVVFAVPDLAAVEEFYVRRLGFIVSDRYRGRAVFLRAAMNGNHHHLFLLNSADGHPHFNHVSFKVRDIHEMIGGGQFLVRRGWETQAGPGRHFLSSACFWYFASPLGGAFEYAADEDMVTSAWEPGTHDMSPEIFTEWKFNLPAGAAVSMPILASRTA